MKKFLLVFVFAFFLVFPIQVYAMAAIGGFGLETTQLLGWAADLMAWVKDAEQMATQIDHLYDQLQHLKRTEERYMKNLKSIMDVKSFEAFMDWFNRSMYIEREAERIYSGMGVTVGNKKYSLHEIDEIPDALRNEYTDRNWDSMSEEERYKVWTTLGVSPSNYFYIKTWQKREEDIKKRFIAAREMHADELEEAADRNNSVLEEYSEESEDIDSNKIAKNSHATQMQIEMVLRDLSLSLDDLKDYIVTRDQEDKTLANPMRPSESWNSNYFKPITGAKVKDDFKN